MAIGNNLWISSRSRKKGLDTGRWHDGPHVSDAKNAKVIE